MGRVVPIKPGIADDTPEPPKPNELLIQWVEELLAEVRAGEVRTCLVAYVQDGHMTGRFHAFEDAPDLALLLLETRRAFTELEVEDED
jgi:hypothetical protein